MHVYPNNPDHKLPLLGLTHLQEQIFLLTLFSLRPFLQLLEVCFQLLANKIRCLGQSGNQSVLIHK